MQPRKKLVLATLAAFVIGLGAAGIHRAIAAPRPVLFHAADAPALGKTNAEIELIVFEDLACTSCRRFTKEILPQIEAVYIEPGIARFVLIPVVLNKESKMMANAILEVYHQAPSQVFPFLHELIVEFDGKEPNAMELIDLAMRMGNIQLVDFARSIETGGHDRELDVNLQLAKRAMRKDLRTPALFINGFPTSPHSFEKISMQIDRIIKETKQ